MLDNITALSADASRLASEAIPDMSQVDTEQALQMIRKATAKWQDYGFELDFADLGYQGERNDVATYLREG
jgi:O-methyltransferase involved in polyketide biosynthesis